MSKILVVDDENSMRITLSAFLKAEGYEVWTAPNGIEAMKIIADTPIDVVITDIIMPGMTGIELIEKIRLLSQEIRVVVMTGEPTVDTAKIAVQNGASDYLAKPIHKADFLKVVRNASQFKQVIDSKHELEEKNQEYQRDLEIKVRQRTVELRKALESIITLLSEVTELRDPYTAGHQRRVGNLAAAIGEKMKLKDEDVELIRILGYIHDIGKITIPTEILSKPGKLSRLEFEMLRGHSQNGYEMLQKVDLPPLIAEAVYQHHERCDGSGYPRGLTSEKILREAHILMVADVVEALMSHRPYRPSLGNDAGIHEIVENRGTLYREDVVDACLTLFKEGYIIDDKTHSIIVPF